MIKLNAAEKLKKLLLLYKRFLEEIGQEIC